jgi:DNA-binding LytR/AlgR family response regulator
MLRMARGFKFKNLDSILYIKASDKNCEIYNTDGTVETIFHSLKEMEERLCCGAVFGCYHFVRIHKQYIAAIHYATFYDLKAGISMENEIMLPVGRKWKSNIKEKLL